MTPGTGASHAFRIEIGAAPAVTLLSDTMATQQDPRALLALGSQGVSLRSSTPTSLWLGSTAPAADPPGHTVPIKSSLQENASSTGMHWCLLQSEALLQG